MLAPNAKRFLAFRFNFVRDWKNMSHFNVISNRFFECYAASPGIEIKDFSNFFFHSSKCTSSLTFLIIN